jgi:hypothetical protein
LGLGLIMFRKIFISSFEVFIQALSLVFIEFLLIQ